MLSWIIPGLPQKFKNLGVPKSLITTFVDIEKQLYCPLKAITVSAAWRIKKKSQSYIRKFYPSPLIAFAYYLAPGSGPSANKAALHRNDKDKKNVCGEIAFWVSTCFCAYQVLSSAVHWIQNKSALGKNRKNISAI